MHKEKNIYLGYSLGLLVVTILVILLQYLILYNGKKLLIFGWFMPIILLIFSAIVIPIIGLNIIIKICIKKSENNIKISSLLSKIVIINFIFILFSAIFFIYKFHLIPNNDILFIFNIPKVTESTVLSISDIDNLGQNQINLFIINNIKNMLVLIIISIIYTIVLTIIFVKNKINSILEIKKEDREKQINLSIIISFIFIIIGVLTYMSLNYIKDNIIQTSVIEGTIYLKVGISDEERKKVEDKIKEIDEIISYEYKTESDELDNFKSKLGSVLDKYKDDNIFPSSYNINLLNKNAEIVNQKLKNIDGIKNINLKKLMDY